MSKNVLIKHMSNEHQNGNYFWKILVSILTVIVIFVVTVTVSWIYMDNNKTASSVNVQGQAKINAIPDKATIYLYADVTGDNSETINASLDKIESDILEYLKLNEIESSAINTNRSIFEDYNYLPPQTNASEKLNRGNLSIELTFKDIFEDLQKPRQIVQDSIKKGVSRYSQFVYDFGDTTKTCQELETKAIENALNKAYQRIDALGGGKIKSKKILSVQGCDQNGISYPNSFPAQSSVFDLTQEAIKLDLNPGNQELQVNVELLVEFK